jgi:hypothetical protein
MRYKRLILFCVLALLLGHGTAVAQGRDSIANGALIGAGLGAAAGLAFTHVVRDSDLTFGQYAYGAVVFGAIGAAAGVGLDALLSRSSPAPSTSPPRVAIAANVRRNVKAVVVKFRW